LSSLLSVAPLTVSPRILSDFHCAKMTLPFVTSATLVHTLTMTAISY